MKKPKHSVTHDMRERTITFGSFVLLSPSTSMASAPAAAPSSLSSSMSSCTPPRNSTKRGEKLMSSRGHVHTIKRQELQDRQAFVLSRKTCTRQVPLLPVALSLNVSSSCAGLLTGASSVTF